MSGYPYTLPEPGAPLRVAFVGQATYFKACVPPPGAAPTIEPHFLDHRGGEDPERLVAALEALAPHVVVVFRPEILRPGMLSDLDAVTLGFNTEPLPRGDADGAHPDQTFRLSELMQTDAAQYDRIITFDPLSAAAAEPHMAVWRSLPLPVSDALFRPVRPPGRPVRVSFVGYSTKHRERYLVDVKHHYDVLHVAHGVHGEELSQIFDRTDVAINLHGEPYPSFENRVVLHLAAGHLVISEPLSPLHGLEPGVDFLEITSPGQLTETVGGIRALGDVHDAVRRRGRRKAEQFRASRMWPRILGDLVRDVGVFGPR